MRTSLPQERPHDTLILPNDSADPSGILRRHRLAGRALWGCSLLLGVSLGCVNPSLQSERVDVIQNPDLVKQCTLKSEGTYTALGEKNALTMAKNATVQKGGNVFLLTSLDRGDALTTAVSGKIYTCTHRP